MSRAEFALFSILRVPAENLIDDFGIIAVLGSIGVLSSFGMLSGLITYSDDFWLGCERIFAMPRLPTLILIAAAWDRTKYSSSIGKAPVLTGSSWFTYLGVVTKLDVAKVLICRTLLCFLICASWWAFSLILFATVSMSWNFYCDKFFGFPINRHWGGWSRVRMPILRRGCFFAVVKYVFLLSIFCCSVGITSAGLVTFFSLPVLLLLLFLINGRRKRLK